MHIFDIILLTLASMTFVLIFIYFALLFFYRDGTTFIEHFLFIVPVIFIFMFLISIYDSASQITNASNLSNAITEKYQKIKNIAQLDNIDNEIKYDKGILLSDEIGNVNIFNIGYKSYKIKVSNIKNLDVCSLLLKEQIKNKWDLINDKKNIDINTTCNNISLPEKKYVDLSFVKIIE